MYGMEKIPEEIESYIQAAAAEPAMEESAIFDEVVDIVVKGGYDYYIYDLVPLGHALYYLSMASVYDAWIGKITGLRQQMREYDQVAAVMRREKELDEDAILNELLYIKERINKSSSILTDKEKTAFFFVVTAEQMVIYDTVKAAELFAQFDVPLSGYIVNRVLSDSLRGQDIPEYLKNRLAMQEHYLKVIDETFAGQILASVPEMERDVTGSCHDRKAGGCHVLKGFCRRRSRRGRNQHKQQHHVSMSNSWRITPGSSTFSLAARAALGKTVMAGAAALWSAKKGKRTLLASTNPVHSLSNLFGQDVFGKPAVVCDEERCHAFEIDTRDSHRAVEAGDPGKDQLVPEVRRHHDQGATIL